MSSHGGPVFSPPSFSPLNASMSLSRARVSDLSRRYPCSCVSYAAVNFRDHFLDFRTSPRLPESVSCTHVSLKKGRYLAQGFMKSALTRRAARGRLAEHLGRMSISPTAFDAGAAILAVPRPLRLPSPPSRVPVRLPGTNRMRALSLPYEPDAHLSPAPCEGPPFTRIDAPRGSWK